jgi:hypothetical protein
MSSASWRKGVGALLVLATCTTARAQAVADHLKCYKVKDPQAKASYTADLGGLIAEPGCTIKVPAAMACVPATKVNVNPAPPPGTGATGAPNAFGCYKIKCPKATLPALPLNDQFGSRSVTPQAPKLLCAPAPPPCRPPDAAGCCTFFTVGVGSVCVSIVGESGNASGGQTACANSGGTFTSGTCDLSTCGVTPEPLVGCCTFDSIAPAPFTCSTEEVTSTNPGLASGAVQSSCTGAGGTFASTHCNVPSRCSDPSSFCTVGVSCPNAEELSYPCANNGDCAFQHCVSSNTAGCTCDANVTTNCCY